MRVAEILRKQEQLARLEESMRTAEERIKSISHDIRTLERSRHRHKLLQAGEVLEKADMLETFSPDKLYEVLVENRDRICDMEDGDVLYEI